MKNSFEAKIMLFFSTLGKMEILPKLLHKMDIQCSENLKEEYI